MGDEIGGHQVSGHVHTTAVLCAVDQRDPNNLKLSFQVCMCQIMADALQQIDAVLLWFKNPLNS
jgi:riboflavin synthase alpha subunit